jgi:2,4-dienoyl-CoA reductase-like NADH-dependent reductase (Old Yellow Enzyme family)
VPGLGRVVDFLHAHGSAAGIQLAHAGAKAASLRPWDGEGPVTAERTHAPARSPGPPCPPARCRSPRARPHRAH